MGHPSTLTDHLKIYGARVRSGKATPDDAAKLVRAQRCFDYLCARRQRHSRPINGWWDLPIAKAMWDGDAADRNA